MASTYQSVNISAIGGSGGSIPHTTSFIVSSWANNSPNYEISIPSSVHGKGAAIVVQVFEKVGVDFNEVMVDIKISSIGDVTIIITETPDLRFEGKVVIIGE